MDENLNENLKYLVLGYRKYRGKSKKELAEELNVPPEIVDGLELGSHKKTSHELSERIEEITKDFDKQQLIDYGHGYRIKDMMGPDFKYFLKGLEEITDINADELQLLSQEECYHTIGKAAGNSDMDEYAIVNLGRTAA